jgi:glycosyltransferase involved in cell wall biosynthesis
MLTVLLATRNRAPLLGRVLEAFCLLRPPPGGWKLVIVDNGSTDATADVLAGFGGRLPLQSLHEPIPGKNQALNAGLTLVQGDLTVLTDDDVFPSPDWLVELDAAAHRQGDYSIFGGAVRARWERPPPRWVEWVEAGPVYTLTDPSWVEGPISPSLVFGPNMAVRTSIFAAGQRFDATIGPRGSSYPMGSETELVQRLGRLGHRAWHVPTASVEHFIRADQLRQSWVLKRAVRFGRGKYRLASIAALAEGHKGRPLLATYLFRRIAKELVMVVASGLLLRRRDLFRSRWRFNFWRGQIVEAWQHGNGSGGSA